MCVWEDKSRKGLAAPLPIKKPIMTTKEAIKILRLNRAKMNGSVNAALDVLIPELKEQRIEEDLELASFEIAVSATLICYKYENIIDPRDYVRASAARLLVYAKEV